jgi:hypothetical protein
MKRYKRVPLLKSDIVDNNHTMYTKDCLKDLAKRSGQIKLTIGYDGPQVGICEKFKFKQDTLSSDIVFDREKQNLGKNIYPCICAKVDSFLYKNMGRQEIEIIEKGSLISVGMCDNHADANIKPLNIKKEKKK